MPASRSALPLTALFALVAATASAQPRGGLMTDLAKDVAEVETKIVERVVSTAEKLPLAKPKEEQTKQMQDAK